MTSFGTCNASSPDGKVGCTKRAGHKSSDCHNPNFGGATWCGDCMKWICEHVLGGPQPELRSESAK